MLNLTITEIICKQFKCATVLKKYLGVIFFYFAEKVLGKFLFFFHIIEVLFPRVTNFVRLKL